MNRLGGAGSGLEAGFALVWSALGDRRLGEPVREHLFGRAMGRRWRFDFAWPQHLVAVEIDGGVRMIGRHQRADGYQRDLEKLNAAAELGWCVLRYSGGDLRRRPVQVIEQVVRVLRSHGE